MSLESTIREMTSKVSLNEDTLDEAGVQTDHLHVSHIKGGTAYQIHGVGRDWADHFKVGEHLSDTEMDDFQEMGGKFKLIKPKKVHEEILGDDDDDDEHDTRTHKDFIVHHQHNIGIYSGRLATPHNQKLLKLHTDALNLHQVALDHEKVIFHNDRYLPDGHTRKEPMSDEEHTKWNDGSAKAYKASNAIKTINMHKESVDGDTLDENVNSRTYSHKDSSFIHRTDYELLKDVDPKEAQEHLDIANLFDKAQELKRGFKKHTVKQREEYNATSRKAFKASREIIDRTLRNRDNGMYEETLDEARVGDNDMHITPNVHLGYGQDYYTVCNVGKHAANFVNKGETIHKSKFMDLAKDGNSVKIKQIDDKGKVTHSWDWDSENMKKINEDTLDEAAPSIIHIIDKMFHHQAMANRHWDLVDKYRDVGDLEKAKKHLKATSAHLTINDRFNGVVKDHARTGKVRYTTDMQSQSREANDMTKGLKVNMNQENLDEGAQYEDDIEQHEQYAPMHHDMADVLQDSHPKLAAKHLEAGNLHKTALKLERKYERDRRKGTSTAEQKSTYEDASRKAWKASEPKHMGFDFNTDHKDINEEGHYDMSEYNMNEETLDEGVTSELIAITSRKIRDHKKLEQFHSDHENSDDPDDFHFKARVAHQKAKDAHMNIRSVLERKYGAFAPNQQEDAFELSSAAKKATRAAKKSMNEEGHYDMSEDVNALTEGENLSEEFKTKAATIFEVAVINRVKQEVDKLDETYEENLIEEVESIKKGLVEKVDGYLDYIVEQWLKDNEIALEHAMKSEILENFVGGLKSLFEEHYIDVPEEKFDIVTSLEDDMASVNEMLDNQVAVNIELNKKLRVFEINEVTNNLAKGLVETDREKFLTLVEDIDGDIDSFAEKAQTIRESYFGPTITKRRVGSSVVTNNPIPLDEEHTNIHPSVRNYVSALNNSKQ